MNSSHMKVDVIEPSDAAETVSLQAKQRQFCDAMQRYETQRRYHWFNRTVSVLNVSLQFLLVSLLVLLPLAWSWHLVALFLAYLIADFINGLVHCYMDHKDDYQSLAGPLIAAFHLHHDNLRYQDNAVYTVYFNESGYKVWLVPYLLITLWLVQTDSVPGLLGAVLIYVGVLSSVAEVSHFLCHNHSTSPWVKLLQRLRLLLPVAHHTRHHEEDNVNYAFLNGLTDPLINWLAKRLGQGYRKHTDLHSQLYQRNLRGE